MQPRIALLLVIIPTAIFLGAQLRIGMRDDTTGSVAELLNETAWLQSLGRIMFPFLPPVASDELSGSCGPDGGRISVSGRCTLEIGRSAQRLRGMVLVPAAQTPPAATARYRPIGEPEPSELTLEPGQALRVVALSEGGELTLDCPQCRLSLEIDP